MMMRTVSAVQRLAVTGAEISWVAVEMQAEGQTLEASAQEPWSSNDPMPNSKMDMIGIV